MTGHAKVAIGYHRTPVFSDRALSLMGKHVRVEVTAPSFAVVPWLLIHTRRLALMHERLPLIMAAHHPIAIAEIPFASPNMRDMV